MRRKRNRGKRTVVSPGVDHLEQQLVSPTPSQPAQVSRYSLHLYPVTAESATVTHSHISALAHLLCTGLS